VKTRTRKRSEGSSDRSSCSQTRATFALPLVLVVDDVEDNRDLCAMVLHARGYKVHLAVDGTDALVQARAHHPSLILMDLAMPRMDGFEAARRLRQLPGFGEIRIIGISAFTDRENVERALAAGCDEVLAKPLAPQVLAARVEANLRAISPRGVRTGRMTA
jgi:CheY-like chemotaxis protein